MANLQSLLTIDQEWQDLSNENPQNETKCFQ